MSLAGDFDLSAAEAAVKNPLGSLADFLVPTSRQCLGLEFF